MLDLAEQHLDLGTTRVEQTTAVELTPLHPLRTQVKSTYVGFVFFYFPYRKIIGSFNNHLRIHGILLFIDQHTPTADMASPRKYW